MKAWWLKLSPRERIVVAGGGALVAVLICIQLVIAPVMAWRASALRRAEVAESDYHLVFRSAALAEPAKPSASDDRSVRTVVTERSSEFGVALTFVNALADGSVEIQGGPATPDDVFGFLVDLETAHGVRVSVADITRSNDDPAKVRIQATLARD